MQKKNLLPLLLSFVKERKRRLTDIQISEFWNSID